MAVDPVWFSQEKLGMFNRYQYGYHNPYRFTDPTGMTPDSQVGDAENQGDHTSTGREGGEGGSSDSSDDSSVTPSESEEEKNVKPQMRQPGMYMRGRYTRSLSDAEASVVMDVMSYGIGVSPAGLGVRGLARGILGDLIDPCCFVAGTQVLTLEGYKNIEQINIGELVLSKNVDTGEINWKPVTYTFVKHRPIYELTINVDGINLVLETTADHPFFTDQGMFVDVIDLKIGHVIEGLEKSGVVESVVRTNRTDITYNLEVAEYHTYYVTKKGLLVHNCNLNMKTGSLGRSTKGAYKDVNRTLSDIANSDDVESKKCCVNKLNESLKTRRADKKRQVNKRDKSYVEHRNRINMEQGWKDKIESSIKRNY